MPKHTRKIPEAYLELPPERRGRHSAAFSSSLDNLTTSPVEPAKSSRTPKHSKAFVDGSNSAYQQAPHSDASHAAQHTTTHRSHSKESTPSAPKRKSVSRHKKKPLVHDINYGTRTIGIALRHLRTSTRTQWMKIAGAGICGLALIGCISGAGAAIQSAVGGNWAISANADNANSETPPIPNPNESSETDPEDTSSLETTSDTSLTIEEHLALLTSQPLQNNELGSLPAQQGPYAFIASTGEVFTLSPETQAQLTDALSPFTSAGYNAGYLLVDIESGRGIAANLDQQVYGASAIKAPFILYMLETAFPAGTINFDTPFSEDLAWDSMDGDLTLDDESLYPFMTLAESSITSSDNDAFRIIRANYETPDFRVWLDNLNLENVDSGEWFPYLSARDLGKLWLEMHTFWESGSEEAWWLETHCSLTEMSFVRAALMGQGLYPDIVVADKAGWINGWDPGYHCLTDGAIVTYGGRDYILCAVTDAPYDAYWESCFETLIANVFVAREELA